MTITKKHQNLCCIHCGAGTANDSMAVIRPATGQICCYKCWTAAECAVEDLEDQGVDTISRELFLSRFLPRVISRIRAEQSASV